MRARPSRTAPWPPHASGRRFCCNSANLHEPCVRTELLYQEKRERQEESDQRPRCNDHGLSGQTSSSNAWHGRTTTEGRNKYTYIANPVAAEDIWWPTGRPLKGPPTCTCCALRLTMERFDMKISLNRSLQQDCGIPRPSHPAKHPKPKM